MVMNFYTTTVSVERSMVAVEKSLVELGASEIHKVYDSEGRVAAMHFAAPVNGARVHFKMPTDVERVYECSKDNKKVPSRNRTREHAERVVWRNLHMWLKTLAVLVELGIYKPLDAFLPHLITSMRRNDPITLSDAVQNLPSDSFEMGLLISPKNP